MSDALAQGDDSALMDMTSIVDKVMSEFDALQKAMEELNLHRQEKPKVSFFDRKAKLEAVRLEKASKLLNELTGSQLLELSNQPLEILAKQEEKSQVEQGITQSKSEPLEASPPTQAIPNGVKGPGDSSVHSSPDSSVQAPNTPALSETTLAWNLSGNLQLCLKHAKNQHEIKLFFTDQGVRISFENDLVLTLPALRETLD